jgi:hypothetical protein
MKVFHCDHCGQLLFFENVTCVRCGRALAYVCELRELISLDPLGDAQWRSPRDVRPLRLCANYATHNVCNWAIFVDDPHAICGACRLTRTIPNLSTPGNHRRWYDLEVAKRRLYFTLEHLRLPLRNRHEDPDLGLMFDFLEDAAAPVLTGHADGIITVNLAEADEAERTRRRLSLNEPYRTLLGHFRHESGHYYWDRLVRGTAHLDGFRRHFGDERQDYDAALRQHYQAAPSTWQDRYVSAYASMHPWEDWAETWAHYLHMVDTLETAAACGISLRPRRADEPTLRHLPDPAEGPVSFDRMMDGWAAIAYVLNNLNRGLGNPDPYPFVLAAPSVEKLLFVHRIIAAQPGPKPAGNIDQATIGGPCH